MTTATQHEWLRRVSDYHSGDVSAAEAVVVEEHLADCEECRQALNVYRGFYTLASSPLQLGEPSNAVAQSFPMNDGTRDFPQGDSFGYRPHSNAPRPQRNRLLMGIAALLAASLVIAGFLAVLGPRIGGAGGHPTPTPRPSVTPAGPTPPVQTTNLPAPGTGYTNAGPDRATMLAFAPGSPNIVYACGQAVNDSGPLMISVSNDGGHTWRSRTSPGKLGVCDLSVDPTNPSDLTLLSAYCSAPAATPENLVCGPQLYLYRSYDGGQSWTVINSPGGAWIATQMVWVGSTLYIGTTNGIARSSAAGTFTLLQQTFFGTAADATTSRKLFALHNTVIVQNTDCPTVGSACAITTARSDDLGVHWSLVSAKYQRDDVSLVASGDDGKTLIGQQARTFLISTDGGVTWKLLPSIPTQVSGFTGLVESSQGSHSLQPILEAPDGSIFAQFTLYGSSSGIGSPGDGIYELAPGATNWRYLGPPPGGNLALFVWNSAGHLAVIWGQRGSPSLSGLQHRSF